MRRCMRPGTVLNRLQELDSEISRFTVEGEGAKVWCCPHGSFENCTTDLAANRKTVRHNDGS